LVPAGGQQAEAAGDRFVSGSSDDQGAELLVPPAKLKKSFEIVGIKAACFYFDGPITPTSLKYSVDFQRLFSPVGHSFSVRQALVA
jgi:hypothetical protein